MAIEHRITVVRTGLLKNRVVVVLILFEEDPTQKISAGRIPFKIASPYPPVISKAPIKPSCQYCDAIKGGSITRSHNLNLFLAIVVALSPSARNPISPHESPINEVMIARIEK